ncbi:DUF4232 domain-containing protein [Streptomyces sp. NBC_00683]|uniref:DUF4232 domain-containing protein n=1 Tax=Streptomyces sp. NBC_00683 TaxID=2903670 RepID=UPI002E33F02C|nr:DUF4232 domain-containing protein [Streptomyces sp. NBC_00683]
MRNRNFRRTARTSALGTAALLAALSLTACQEDGQAAADTSTPATAAPSEQPSDSTKAPADKGNGKDKGTNGSGADSGSSSGSSSGSADAEPAAKQPKDTGDDSGPVTLACDGGNSKVKLTAVTRPVNHMLLTVTNTGSKACNAYYHPFLRFGEAQAVPRTFEESKPQAVVTLGPGESAYAGVMTASADGSGTGGYSTKELTVSFQGREGSGSSGPSSDVPLTKAVFVDSTLAVTYWQTGLDDALVY